MPVRTTYTTRNGVTLTLWVVIENNSRKGFSKEFLRDLSRESGHDKRLDHKSITRSDGHVIRMTTDLYPRYQARFEIMKRTSVSLIAQSADGKRVIYPRSRVARERGLRETRMRDIPTTGADKSRYDEFERLIYPEK